MDIDANICIQILIIIPNLINIEKIFIKKKKFQYIKKVGSILRAIKKN